jgi:stage II sporulation protein D
MIKNHFVPSLCTAIFCLFLAACQPPLKELVRGSGPTIRVLIATISEKDSIQFNGSYLLHSEEARYELGEKNRKLYIQPLSDGLQLYNQNRNLLYHNHFPLQLEPMDAQSRFIYNGEEYSGSVRFDQASQTSVYLINQLLLENYLQGVVPAEIPSYKSDDFEAIKAQAICARTYAISRLEARKNRSYDILATVADQVYKGYIHHARLADDAIAQTRGVIITHQGNPATIYYHSTCGGRLEEASNIWPDATAPYLQGGMDAVSEVFSCSASPYFRWMETRSFHLLDSTFFIQYKKQPYLETPPDTLHLSLNMEILGRNSTGRVDSVRLAYADTSVVLSGHQIRSFLRDEQGNSLPSNLFYMTQVDDSTLAIHGGGFGHGVGMCQYGALNMSRRGFQHYHILGKYFPGTKLNRKY